MLTPPKGSGLARGSVARCNCTEKQVMVTWLGKPVDTLLALGWEWGLNVCVCVPGNNLPPARVGAAPSCDYSRSSLASSAFHHSFGFISCFRATSSGDSNNKRSETNVPKKDGTDVLKMCTIDSSLLYACTFLDSTNKTYFTTQETEELIWTLGLPVSRYQVCFSCMLFFL